MAGDMISVQEQMMFESNRLCSFQAWPTNAKAYAFQLAKSGFYYSGEADEVVCFACEGRIRDWQDRDIPMQKHIERYPTCPFICGQISSTNLMPPTLDDDQPSICLKQRVDETVKEMSEMSLKMTNRGVTRGAIAFRDENHRKKSFEGLWSDKWPVTPNALAQAGFYYCGPEDMVQCAWCYGKLQGWKQGDNPLREHKRRFASCPKFGDRKAVDPRSLVKVKWDTDSNNWSDDDLGILTICPCSPQFAIESSRLESFKGKWLPDLPQTAQALSSAGFFYVGYSDNVKCFFCNGGLCNWEANDEPWTEHAKWFPDCGFLKQVKGTRYIEKVREVGGEGHSKDNESPIETSLSFGDHIATRKIASSTFPPTLPKGKVDLVEKMVSNLVINTTDTSTMLEVPNIIGTHTNIPTSLEEENIKLKEQRICKVRVYWLKFLSLFFHVSLIQE